MRYAALLIPVALIAADPVLWVDPGPVASLDLAAGPGGRDGAPKPPFRFVKEEPGGTNPKLDVIDAAGRSWIVKFGPEARPEVFATRIVWAAGYFADKAYFVPEGAIENASELRRASAHVSNGRFREARFELRDPNVKYDESARWSLSESRLQGTKEFGALKALIALLGNWDVKEENMHILQVGGQPRFAITDWGRALGRATDRTGRSEWDCNLYSSDSEHFVLDVERGFVTLNYEGKQRHEVQREVRVEDVKWLADRLGQIGDNQWRDALRSAGATSDEVACFVPAIRKRVAQLASAGSVGPDGEVIRSRKVIRKTIETTTRPAP